MTKKHKKRVLIKISWEALQWEHDHGIDPHFLHDLAKKISRIRDTWVEIAIVLWGGNIFRWVSGAAGWMDRTPADYMWMLATVMNGVAFQDALQSIGLDARLMSALHLPKVAEEYIKQKAVRHLEKWRVIILVAGTGNPYFTTDSAGALRALELSCDMMIKATKVDGVYTKDPKTHDDAELIKKASYKDVINKDIRVMDHTAITLAKDGELIVKVVNLFKPGSILDAIEGKDEGTTIS